MYATKKLQTVRNSRQFRQVYEQGQKFHTAFFSAFVLKTESNEQRIGITVTRKIGNAVIRNRCKRRVREALRKCFADSANLASFDLVLNVKSSLIKAEFKQIVEALAKMIESIQEPRLKIE